MCDIWMQIGWAVQVAALSNISKSGRILDRATSAAPAAPPAAPSAATRATAAPPPAAAPAAPAAAAAPAAPAAPSAASTASALTVIAASASLSSLQYTAAPSILPVAYRLLLLLSLPLLTLASPAAFSASASASVSTRESLALLSSPRPLSLLHHYQHYCLAYYPLYPPALLHEVDHALGLLYMQREEYLRYIHSYPKR
ncbi:hypothetical protein BDW02DRAFT_584041 [Decorospora gaudefroyi]|uniref:Uncharacterized protein n=1 Tax=Decorospora gaudefroyi TaxID=184978 RepID=A0A6A5JY03_9PLEO|nr:hypothetical protein BDW02DRAFT_584041 [Decorospora gaudefroyi]